jgi:hypothetical protein
METNNKLGELQDPPRKGRGPSRNKNAGHSYERDIRDIFRNLGFPYVVTSRSESRSRDNQQIDLINHDEHINGRFPYNIQCKAVSDTINYHNILAGCEKVTTIKRGKRAGEKVTKTVEPMPKVAGVINVIIHKMTKKVIQTATRGGQVVEEEVFLPIGYYAIMHKKDFLQIVAERQELAKLTAEYKELERKYQELCLRQNDTNGSNH